MAVPDAEINSSTRGEDSALADQTPLERRQGLIIHDLRLRLEEAEAVLGAIRRGEVDAIVVKRGVTPQIWSLNGVEHVYRVLFEAINEGAATLSASGYVLYANHQFAALLARPLSRVIGGRFADWIAAPDQDVFQMLLERGLRDSSKGELQVLQPDGTVVPVAVSFNSVEVEQVGTTCTAVVSDLTQLKQVQAALAEANNALEDRVKRRTAELSAEVDRRQRLEVELQARAVQLVEEDRRKNEFLAMLGHELRNPLSPIVNATEVIRLRAGHLLEVERAREVIERQLQHLRRLVDDLLDVSRITRGVIELRREPFDLRRAVEQAVDSCRPPFEASGQQLHVTVAEEPCWLDGDPTRIQQVIGNLLSNATRYTPEGGKVFLDLERHGDCAVLSVRDTGRGIPTEMVGSIFDLFTQVDASIDRSLGGLGIGLTVVRNLVNLHGGTVHAKSLGPGKGAEFCVRLPLLPLERRALAPSGHDAEPASQSLRVMIVEDNVDAAETLAELLELWGHRVRLVYHGKAALAEALNLLPDAIVLDIGLPGQDGYSIARQLHEHPELANTALIALTGYGQEEDRRKALQAGFHVHLTKPINPERLSHLLNALSRSGLAAFRAEG
jgi:PAS domain S-box-containing protein